jgi:hypothetical protein
LMNCAPLLLHVSRTDTKCACHVGIIRTLHSIHNIQETESLNLFFSV